MHYICTGTCGGVSDHPKKCEDEKCPLFERELEPCDCIDGKHHGRQGAHIHSRNG